MLTITAKTRNLKENLAHLRESGSLPAVFYGRNKEAEPISIPEKDFLKVWKEAGESGTVTLKTGNESVSTLIHDVQLHPVTGLPVHADFLVIDENQEIRVNVPLEFTGVAPAVKDGLGTLVKVLHEIEIAALPKDLPHALSVNIEGLAGLDSQILVSDIVLPKGVRSVTKDHEVVAAIAVMKEETEEVAAPVDLSAIEVEKKGKKEEEVIPEETA